MRACACLFVSLSACVQYASVVEFHIYLYSFKKNKTKNQASGTSVANPCLVHIYEWACDCPDNFFSKFPTMAVNIHAMELLHDAEDLKAFFLL